MRPLLNALTASLSTAVPYTLLILSGCWFASTHADDRLVVESIAAWDFGAKEDLRRDGWPDGWSRTTGQKFPKFIPIAIHQKANTAEELAQIERFRRISSQIWLANQQGKWPWQVIPESTPSAIDTWLERTVLNPYLRIEMNGGAAEVLSPLIPVDDHSVYFATGQINASSSDFIPSIKLRFLNSNRKTLFDMAANPITSRAGWQTATTNSLYECFEDIRFVQVVLGVHPVSSKSYRGESGFDAIRIHRTPRLKLSVDKPSQLYGQSEKVTVRCLATGMNTEQTSLILKLFDHNGKEILSVDRRFVRDDSQMKKLISTNTPGAKDLASKYWGGYCDWWLPELEPGYYEISTKLARGTSGPFELRQHFAVLSKHGNGRPDTRFGWTMNASESFFPSGLNTNRFIDTFREGRVGKLKLPIWFDSTDPKSAREVIERIDRVQTAGIQCVGVIASPPKSLRDKYPRLNSDETGSALEDSVLVQSFIEPVLRQMSVRIADFQIGWDHESDFASNPRFSASLDAIVRLARRYGQETQIIAVHNTETRLSPVKGIDRWQLYANEELTKQEMASVTEATDEHSGRSHWLSITPISPNKYSLHVRVQDMVARMLAVVNESGSQSTMAWVSDPTNDQVGMIDKLGGPREMFVPFRSMSAALVGLRNVGSLPHKSLGTNHLLVNLDQAKLIAWSTHTSYAQLYLGENIQAYDIWGRDVPVENLVTDRGKVQRIEIGPWPVIIEGINLEVARWRMGISLEERRIDPLKGQTHELKLRFSNPMGLPASGSVRVLAPAILRDSTTVDVEIEANSSGTINVPVVLLPNANSSISPIQLDFTMNSSVPVRFSIDEELHVGADDIEFEVEYQIDDQNQMWFTIIANNNSDEPISFNCTLLIPNRAHERTLMVNLKGRTNNTILLKDASDLVGETLWLRCEQLGTRRVINLSAEIK